MDFEGEVWFDFRDEAVWHFYRFVRELASQGHRVALEWTPLPDERDADAMAAFVSLATPTERGRFLHAMLGLVHLDGADPSEASTVQDAAEAARIEITSTSSVDLAAIDRRARDMGVHSVPSLYRHGPVVAIRLNGAALMGDAEATARTLLAVADDDGIWEVRKP